MKSKPHEDWLYMATQDLAFAHAGYRDGFYPSVCCLAQQAVEKAIKAYLVFQGKNYPKKHDLLVLEKLLDVKWLKTYLGPLKKLTEFYIPTRYPDALVGSLPEGLPDKKDAEDALKWADEILEIIQAKTKGNESGEGSPQG